MSLIWALLYLLAFSIPLWIVVATSFYVLLQARNLRAHHAGAGDPWKVLVIHLVFVAAIPALMEFSFSSGRFEASMAVIFLRDCLELILPFVVPAVLFLKLGHARRRSIPASTASEGEALIARRIAWTMALAGLLLPWVTAIAVKLTLMGLGKPTLPFASFLDPSIVPHLLRTTLTRWSFPFIALAFFVRYWLLGREKTRLSFSCRRSLAWLTFVGGALGAVPLFAHVFWEYDPLYLFLPLGFLLLPVMAVAYAIGFRVLSRQPDPSPDT